MANAIGTFEMKHTGNTYSRTAEGHLIINAHFEGAGTGFDAVFGTLSLTQELSEASATSGTCTWTGQSFQADGTTLGTLGDGTWEQRPGESKWKVIFNGEISNGDRLRTEGVIDLPARQYTGSIFPA
tara:strand:- start:156 stop:536 length:381 start_codon:yes stop_codon:yes gene_type:complete